VDLMTEESRAKFTDTQQSLAFLKGHTLMIESIAYSPDGKNIASASQDRTVRLWNVETREQLID